MELIVHQGNDYLVSVKGNQPKLLQAIQTVSQQQQPRSHQHTTERRGNRLVHRSVSVFEDVSGIDEQWVNPQSVIAVRRAGTRDGKPFDKMSYYLSSLDADALELGLGIRRHRDIENRLHWVKDVVFGEDAALFPSSNAATFWSIVRTIAINLVRRAGHTSVTRGLRALRHDIDSLFYLVTMN
jgi:predicted transposase YbfD/YdcC